MPPYRAVKSRRQMRKLFVLASQGKISMQDAKGKARAAKKQGKKLPNRVKRKKK